MVLGIGEKRKRKLQYLQDLIKDGSNDEQTPEPSPQRQEAHLRSISAEYELGPSSSPYNLPSHSAFVPLEPNDAAALGSASAASTASFDLLPTTQGFSTFESSWNGAMYSPPSTTQMSWNVPAFIPYVDYPQGVPLRPETSLYAPSFSSSQPAFAQNMNSYLPSRESVTDPSRYYPSYGHQYGSQSHSPGIPSVSSPTSSPYFHGQPGPH